jgi:hypothetical protein
MNRPLCVAGRPLHAALEPVSGGLVMLDGEECYRIANYDRMRPFFMTVVSPSDHWLFLSSTGALTAGRGNPDLALFPYYTEDKIHDSAEVTGGKTIVIVENGRRCLWEPFSERYRGLYQIHRNLYRNRWGNKLTFEEHNQDLALTFRYTWSAGNRFGFVRRARLVSTAAMAVRLSVLDGIQNLMPCGVGSQFQLDKSNLLDAYKRGELLPQTGLALFRLSSIPIDRPEPAEALRATVAWAAGLDPRCRLLSSRQLDRFRDDRPLETETDVRGERGAYFVHAELALAAGEEKSWLIVADVNRGPSDVAALDRLLRRTPSPRALAEADVRQGEEDLRKIIATADGLQQSADRLGDTRHGANVLFNLMRGGVFDDGDRIDPDDLLDFVRSANRDLAARHARFFRRLKPGVTYSEAVGLAAAAKDPQLERLCREYLPLAFSRRHGDPSRPWNRFSIAARRPDGSRFLNYEGNWRDLFQNWEALARSFPRYVTAMICRFVSASTADGYNPYRITRQGLDWEVVDPADPWAHIGYWGDHQLIYLLKLLEILHSHEPATLRDLLRRDIFAYANVPYRIAPYEKLLADPKETVHFDLAAHELARQRVQTVGADGKLVWDARNQVRLVNLTEKLLVSVLAKLSNFIPEAGIWMNTQRPEWNDANNALVGYGVSMVTLCYLRRYLAFCGEVFAEMDEEGAIEVSVEVARLAQRIHRILQAHWPALEGPINDRRRKRVLDELGQAGSAYRMRLYKSGLSGRRIPVRRSFLLRFFETAGAWAEHSIAANRRPDRLYHAYNLAQLDRPGEIHIRRLYEMLEGQVAVLSSGYLTAEESAVVLTALRNSSMFRADQHGYLLYPNRELPRFIERNNIPPRDIQRSRLLRKLLSEGDRSLVEKDANGRFHFNGCLSNAADVSRALDQLALAGHAARVKRERAAILRVFEELFDHQSFTGRSGTFFAYEGLGSIYWHMVSKLLLAIQETFFRACEAKAPAPLLQRLAESYYDVRAGLGDHKAPGVYGAFPVDPYSHTPAHAGARQPGLTGQVKEDILCRLGELGVFVRDGAIVFRPRLLRASEFAEEPADFLYYDVSNSPRRLPLPPRSLAFTYCQVPIVFRLGATESVSVRCSDGSALDAGVLSLGPGDSRSIFDRAGWISEITANLTANSICPVGVP